MGRPMPGWEIAILDAERRSPCRRGSAARYACARAATRTTRWATGGCRRPAALAREVGVLRLSLAGQGALELAEEGPRVGQRQGWAAAVPRRAGALLTLAVFSSEGCPMCQRVAPAVAHLAADPLLALRVFDEVADAATWSAARVPGSPYAVALDLSGIALAKGSSTTSCSSRASSPPPARANRSSRLPPEEHLADAVLRHSDRRGFLERLGGAVIALAGSKTVAGLVLPNDADAYTNFCGHTYTTGNCRGSTPRPASRGAPRTASRLTTSGARSTRRASRSTRRATP